MFLFISKLYLFEKVIITMIELFDADIKTDNRKSSKGNQLKWERNGYWYKADYCGYEGLAEYACSLLLQHADLGGFDFAAYDTTEISYRNAKYLGCVSKNFLNEGEQLITCERLFYNEYQRSLTEAVWHLPDHQERLRFLVDQIILITGLKDFGKYMNVLMTVDALVLNEDRHFHNIAVIWKPDGGYRYAPVFDQGAGLLSDTRMDYPLGMDLYEAIDSVRPKTFADDFTEQLEISEALYGDNIHFHLTMSELQEALAREPFYDSTVKQRVFAVLTDRHRKYGYLFG